MKCPKCKGLTGVTQSHKSVDNSTRRTRQCKACGYEFTTYEFTEESIRDYLQERKADMLSEGHISRSICWECSRATGFCSWSRFFEPVKGWKAKKTTVKAWQGEIDSYEVYKCPLFEQDRKK